MVRVREDDDGDAMMRDVCGAKGARGGVSIVD